MRRCCWDRLVSLFGIVRKGFDLYGAQVLLGSVVDSWDKLRETATEALMALPAPLPGLEAPAQVAKLLRWARTLVSSPRVRESDAGL